MARFPNQKTAVLLFKPLSDFNVNAEFRAETPASSSVSSRLPVILLQKSSHIPSAQALRTICFEQV